MKIDDVFNISSECRIDRVKRNRSASGSLPERERISHRAGDERLVPANGLIPALLKTSVHVVLKGRTTFGLAEYPVQQSGGRARGRSDRRSGARRAYNRASYGTRCGTDGSTSNGPGCRISCVAAAGVGTGRLCEINAARDIMFRGL